MLAPDGRNWWRLVGVAVVMALIMVPIAIMALFGLHAATWTETWSLFDPTSNPPFWLTALAAALAWVLLLIPGAVVGRVAGLSRGWRRTAAVMAALGGVATTTAWGEIVGAVPGLIGGSLLAVVLADRLGDGGVEVPHDADRPGPMRSREERVIAGVCGGWARAHGWGPVRVRVLTVLVAVAGVVAVWPWVPVLVLVLYVVAWLTWPLEPAEVSTTPSAMV
jgi:phage shock protein PspC (stress-responsive transcriptional regulator)